MARNVTGVANLKMFHTETLDIFSMWYSEWHGYISLVICSLGIPLNVINITVLTRKNMQTPINCILTWLAVSDIATMISYMPFAVHFYCHYSANSISSQKNSRGWMNFLLVYLNFSATTHTISIWLGVAIAIFRHHHIQSPAKGNLTRMRRMIRARLVVGIIFSLSIVAMIPNYMSHHLIQHTLRSDNSTVYIFEPWNLGSGNERPIILVGLILYSVLAKLVPCILILVYGTLLLITLKNVLRNKRRRSSTGSCISSQRNTEASRTTVMLLIVMILFVITELPQAILIMCCISLKQFFEKVYIPLGDVMDIVALINSGVNFVLYCTMSQEFRRTFIQMVGSFSIGRRRPTAYISTRTRNNELQVTFTELHTAPDEVKL